MEEIRVFENPAFGQIRTAGTADEPLFCLADVCKVLDLQPSRVKSRLNQGGVTLSKVGVQTGVRSDGTPVTQEVEMTFVNESNLYRVIMRSDKPQAESFQDWVCGEVLPSIRRHGAYMVDSVLEQALANPDFLIKLATELKEEKQARLLAENDAKLKQIEIEKQKPKVEFYDKVTKSETLIDMKCVAKVLNYKKVGRNNLFKILREKGILSERNEPYQSYVDAGYFKVVESYRTQRGKPVVYTQTMVYQKGVDYINRILKECVGDRAEQYKLF